MKPLEDRYRPKRYSDFVGQHDAVEILRRLSQREIRRNLLLKGDLGSGKTSFARVYSASLFCSAKSPDGSPCGVCKICSDESYLFEYDTPREGGDERAVEALLEKVRFKARTSSGAVAFFDECHKLTHAAQSALLKRVEANNENIVFIFATTEPQKLLSTFQSRLTKIGVNALTHAASVRFLENVAKNEGYQFTREGLSLIAAFENGFPRALLKSLETIALAHNNIIDADAVKSVNGRHRAECLVRYTTALADGDASAQSMSMQSWPGPLRDKVAAVQGFFQTFYYNNVLGADVVGYPLAYALTSERAEIASKFCARLNVKEAADLEPAMTRLLDFWVGRASPLPLSLALFENLVNRGLHAPNLAPATIPSTQKPDQSMRMSVQAPRLDSVGEERFFDCDDARTIINAASFFVQEFGICLNASFIVSSTRRASEDDVRAAVGEFMAQLEHRFGRSSTFGAVVLFERTSTGVIARVLAHIPELAATTSQLESFANDYRGVLDLVVEFDLACAEGTDQEQLKFHLREAMRLCGALVDDGVDVRASGLMTVIKEMRSSGLVKTPPIIFAGSLKTIEAGEFVPFLSALDVGAYRAISSGFEFQEHQYRKRLTVERETAFNELYFHFDTTAEIANQEQKLKAAWTNADQVHIANWIRKWKGSGGA